MNYNEDDLNRDRTLKRIEQDIRKYVHLSSYQREFVLQCISLAYGAGYDCGRSQKQKSRPVHQIKDGRIIQTFPSITKAANAMHCDKSLIHRAASGKAKHAHGFKWRYATQKRSPRSKSRASTHNEQP